MVTVRRSTVLDSPVDAVWRILRDFNGHARWHPAVVESAIEANKDPDQVGAVRRFRLSNGATLREQLLKLSDHERSLTYCILESPIPLIGYVATVTLRPVTDGGRTFWDWRSSFRAPPGQESSLAQMVGHDIYEAGFEGLRAMLGSGAAPRRGPAPVSGSASIAGQAIVLQRHGGPDELRPQRIEAPPPGPGEVRLRQTAIGLNYIDIYVRTGLYPLLTPPGVPGMEAAGTVVDVGPGVVELMPGDHVAYACPPVGAYAEIRTMKADQLVMLPPDIDDAIAAAVMLKGMTAECLLRRTHRVKRGDTILIHAAAGGVGLLLCQWARHIGATVVGTVGTEIKARLAREAGCAFPVVYTQQDFVEAVREITKGRGVDVV
jgi:hypothetical protein